MLPPYHDSRDAWAQMGAVMLLPMRSAPPAPPLDTPPHPIPTRTADSEPRQRSSVDNIGA